ncbi:hypothetical protein NA78x_000310 [Anatilimnocola sp. NA78]|uniref:hypothetical protein n=1 Tax=Anatilimnocola sp. NA78 TaxID=3415683 RepID=UPI003CE51AEB
MKFSATGSTDVALVGLFWPESLPADFDERIEHTELKLLCNELHDQQQIVSFPCEANGSYSLNVFVDEELPAELQPYCEEVHWLRKLEIAGTGWFGGLEYLFKTDRAELDSRPGGCSPLEIPAGEYEVTAYATEVPDDVYETWLLEKTSPAALRLWHVQSWFAATGIVALMFFVGCMFLGSRTAMLTSAAISAVLSSIALVLSLTPAYRRVQAARQTYDAMYSDYVVCMVRK